MRRLGTHKSDVRDTDHTAPCQARAGRGPCCAESRGFSLHANSVARDKSTIRIIVSYIARPAVSTERLTEDKNGELIYDLKRQWKNGVTAIKLAPHELLERLLSLVPPFYSHTVRYLARMAPPPAIEVKSRSKEFPVQTKKLQTRTQKLAHSMGAAFEERFSLRSHSVFAEWQADTSHWHCLWKVYVPAQLLFKGRLRK